MATHKVYAVPKIEEMKKLKFDDLLASLESDSLWDFYDKNPSANTREKISPVSKAEIKAKFSAENAPLEIFERTVSLKNAVEALRESGQLETWLPAILR